MPKVHKNSGDNSYTITYKVNAAGVLNQKEYTKENWVARNSFDAQESFLKANPAAIIVKVERQMVSHLA